MRITRRDFHKAAIRTAGAGLVLLYHPKILLAETIQVAFQPFAAQVTRLLAALDLIGEPLPAADLSQIHAALARKDEAAALETIQQCLDRHVLMNVLVNPESRISVSRGQAPARLIEQGWRSFLVKVTNLAADTATLKIRSPQALPVGRRSSLAITGVHDFTNGAVDSVESRKRWLAIDTWDLPPLQPTLSGLALEYRILQLYSRDRGQREASLVADAGYGEQDLGFRSTLPILFECMPANQVHLHIRDADGSPATASLLITDALQRIYPPQSKRDLPDLWFERQIYRRDGEILHLPTGQYTIEAGRGPEYLRTRTSVTVAEQTPPLAFALERWINPASFGFYSGDTHIHAAGCSHYESPTEGVTPEVMFRQVEGEALDLGDVLNWGPGFEYQKQFFRGHVEKPGDLASDVAAKSHHHDMPMPAPSSPPHATAGSATMRYDVEVSGFPSSHCGHLVLLRLKEQIYPGAATIDQWPSWNLPILRWARAQGAIIGYAHSGHGLVVPTTDLPNFLIPPFDSSGANEFLVDITHEDAVDFLSGCDTMPFVELNVWYHTLNCGFRSAFAGETDFPCITDDRVGGGRSYVQLQSPPAGDEGYSRWVEGLRRGRSYIGDGRSHVFDLALTHNGQTSTSDNISVNHAAPNQTVQVTARVCARLEPAITETTRAIQRSSPYDKPYWHLERARLGASRKVPVELIVNGISVQTIEIEADGALHPVRFDAPIPHTSWIALRIFPSVHTSPVFVTVDARPLRASKRSAKWCREAVDACWAQKSQRIRPAELAAAAAAYDHARRAYDQVIAESVHG